MSLRVVEFLLHLGMCSISSKVLCVLLVKSQGPFSLGSDKIPEAGSLRKGGDIALQSGNMIPYGGGIRGGSWATVLEVRRQAGH